MNDYGNPKEIPGGCIASGFLSVLMWLMLFYMLFASCSPRQYTLSPDGEVIRKDGERTLVLFKCTQNKDRFATAWFYFPDTPDFDTKTHTVELKLIKIDLK